MKILSFQPYWSASVCTFSEFSFVNSSVKSSENVLTSIINSLTHSVWRVVFTYERHSSSHFAAGNQISTFILISVTKEADLAALELTSEQTRAFIELGEKKIFSSRNLSLNLHCKNISVQHIVSGLFSGSSLWGQSAFFFNSKSTNISLKS